MRACIDDDFTSRKFCLRVVSKKVQFLCCMRIYGCCLPNNRNFLYAILFLIILAWGSGFYFNHHSIVATWREQRKCIVAAKKQSDRNLSHFWDGSQSQFEFLRFYSTAKRKFVQQRFFVTVDMYFVFSPWADICRMSALIAILFVINSVFRAGYRDSLVLLADFLPLQRDPLQQLPLTWPTTLRT